MRYLICLVMIVVFNLLASILALAFGVEQSDVTGAVAIGVVSVLATDYYITKVGD